MTLTEFKPNQIKVIFICVYYKLSVLHSPPQFKKTKEAFTPCDVKRATTHKSIMIYYVLPQEGENPSRIYIFALNLNELRISKKMTGCLHFSTNIPFRCSILLNQLLCERALTIQTKTVYILKFKSVFLLLLSILVNIFPKRFCCCITTHNR